MSQSPSPGLETLLQHPDVLEATANINPELRERLKYAPPRCEVFAFPCTTLRPAEEYYFEVDAEARRRLPRIIDNKVQVLAAAPSPDPSFEACYHKKRNVGIVFSGGPAPGGHNVIAGLFDAVREANPDSRVFGFLMGPDGIVENEAVELSAELVSRETCRQLRLDALVVVGGDDSNTNAAFLAEAMHADGIQVIGVPKTIDGDIQVRDAGGRSLCAMSFGFHSAARAFANAVSNLCTDSGSDVKYWHICKVMGRVASHLALEVALQTHANITLIGEDLADYVDRSRLEKVRGSGETDYTAYGMTLRHLSRVICDGIVRRAAAGKNYGVAVIPEGVLEFINEIQVFIIKLNTIIGDYNTTHDTDFHLDFPVLEDKLEYLRRLARRARESDAFTVWNTRDDDLFNDIPAFFQEGLLMERDSHGNFQFSQVDTEKVVLGLVKDYLKILKEKGVYKLGLERSWYRKTLQRAGLDPDGYGPVLFRNYAGDGLLLVREAIISQKTLRQELARAGRLAEDAPLPAALLKVYEKSDPKFKTQVHFYGYDGRGNDPTRFDCIYTYNLGLTVFSLIANGATGQMAAIRNLELDFNRWEPIGIPIAPLMHLEERKGRLTLVLEKSVVDLQNPAFLVVKACREKWLAATPGPDNYRRPGPIRFAGKSEENRPITLVLNAIDPRPD